MKKRWYGFLKLGSIGLLLCAITAFAHAVDDPAPAASATPPPPSYANDTDTAGNRDIQRILRAMREADAPALIKLYQGASDPIVHIWAAMALERVHYNLDAATADARLCEKTLFDNHPAIALLCGQFQSGNLRLAGRHAEADAYEKELIARYRGHGVDRQLAGMQGYTDRAPAAKLAIERPAVDVTLSLKQDQSSPVVDAKANGHTFELMFDSGASDLVLGEADARRLGVRILDEQPSRRVNGWLSHGVPARRGQLDRLQLGAISLRNVPVTVVPKQIALLGANMLAPLGSVRISRKSLLIYGDKSTVPACDQPLLTSSDLWGSQLRLLPQLMVNDAPRSVMLDTGAGSYLLGTKAALDEVTALHRGKLGMGDIGGAHPFANAERAKVMLEIAGQPIEVYFAVYTDSDLGHPITLGAGALRDMDFLLDFRHQHMCFLLHPGLQ